MDFNATTVDSNRKKLYDVLIIGGSYAGLSAALTLYRATHTCLIFDSGVPRNAKSTQTRLTSGWEGEDPKTMREKSRAELESSGLVDFVASSVQTARKLEDGTFQVADGNDKIWNGRKILLSTGVNEIYPQIPGYAENYGTSIYYCMFCFGYEQRGSRTAGLLASGQLSHPGHALTNAQDAHKFAESVTIFTNGSPALADELSQKTVAGIRVNDQKLKRFIKEPDADNIKVEFENGEIESFSFLVHKPDLEIDASLPKQLGLECVPGFGIKVTPPFNQTSVEGVYAAGDCCSPLRMIPNAMNMGAFAGCGLARELPRGAFVMPEKVKESSGLVESTAIQI
ncbi:unnamed protein product [Periconia digitata]|uniref:FAD/NAD(P)-binding domain-containing protein n=1 Tax=Periconia digitata TaxID=1303443 RepID=A0A9W4UEL6_9PLEO|nr:unnamed protein product [Periconia digitata]